MRAHVVTRSLSQLLLDVLRNDVDQACPANTVFKRMYLGRLYLLLSLVSRLIGIGFGARELAAIIS